MFCFPAWGAVGERWGIERAGRKDRGAGKGERSAACMNEEEEEGRKRPASCRGSLSYTQLGTVNWVLLPLL